MIQVKWHKLCLLSCTGKMAQIVSFVMSLIVLGIAYPLFGALMTPAIKNPTININNVDFIYCGLTAVFCLCINVLLEQGRATNLVYVKGLETAGDIAFPVISSIITSFRDGRRYCISSDKFYHHIMGVYSRSFSTSMHRLQIRYLWCFYWRLPRRMCTRNWLLYSLAKW